MFDFKKTIANGKAEYALSGRLDTITAPTLEAEFNSSLDGVTSLVLDLGDLAYVSSAGLRVLLSAQKKMNAQGEMKVRRVNDTVKEIFDVTGFSDILDIE
ncbi:MAG: STAS domain-containing protein [Clostridia bacterium]|nr:STAS domain-containing protein [Clostridia bacterium]